MNDSCFKLRPELDGPARGQILDREAVAFVVSWVAKAMVAGVLGAAGLITMYGVWLSITLGGTQ